MDVSKTVAEQPGQASIIYGKQDITLFSVVVQILLNFGARTDVCRDNIYTPFYTAVGHGNKEVVHILATRDPSLIEAKQPMRPIYLASILAAWSGVEVLLEHGACPNGGLQSGQTEGEWAPLVAAVESGYTKSVRLLLDGGADPNMTGPSGQDTPLWFACIRAASVECVQLLLDHRADPNDPAIVPPLLIEMMNSDTSPDAVSLAILELLSTSSVPLQINVKDPYSGVTPLMIAARQGKTGLVRWLLAKGADFSLLDNHNCSALWYAIKKGVLKGVQEIIQRDPPLDILTKDGATLLEAALENTAILELLLDSGAPVNLRNGDSLSAINVAVVQQNVEAVKLLLKRQPDLEYRDTAGWTPILDAVGCVGNAEITRLLAEGGANLQSTNRSGHGVLHFAMSQDPSILQVLLEFRKSIDLEMRDQDGNTPLLLGRDDHLVNIRLLLRAGADINAQNRNKISSLMSAVISRQRETVDLLLKQPDVDVNTTCPSMGTALVLACRRLDVELVVRLIAADADLEASGPLTTPLMAACFPYSIYGSGEMESSHQILAHLLSHGANIATTHPSIFFNVLSVACLAATPRTINYLLDKGAWTQIKDPLGRLPIHFAAANGLGNFQVTMLATEEMDVMAADQMGKNALHWAAQFGHAQTIHEILCWVDQHSQQKRDMYVNQPDQDGWTPLCWAARPFSGGWAAHMQTEPRDYLETIRLLLQNGADRTWECSMGIGSTAERLTPLKLADRCDADDEILQLLRCPPPPPPEHEEVANDDHHHPQRKYTSLRSVTCDICLIVSATPVICHSEFFLPLVLSRDL
ncbi:hypothetical protein N7537_008173 [Penicillium hordei]|uniref:Uncharacterized protein n=1 Tax=Penicillium hordei TaxID=40994 RepID=A0AAD6DZZ7_9EURO|nr:uncharacterized protein N7537_008173 [Penicillium hordei]KAJ5598089.1 hypothetical protein N7537_008173 [Penicillium hordei]